MRDSHLKKLHKDPSGCLWDDEVSFPVLHVQNSHALTKAAGYLKFIFRKDFNVVFRGQSRLHESLTPSLFRKVKQQKTMNDWEAALSTFVDRAAEKKAFLNQTPEYAFRPLLQHYGIRTQWLDVVDNIWVATWFAAHEAIGFGRNGNSVHFERRRESDAGKDYCYVLMVRAPGLRGKETEPGFYETDEVTSIDLRKAVPSIYIRPHSQHGLLIRRTRYGRVPDTDLLSLVAGVIRVRLRDALEWLGNSTLLSAHTLFPPPFYDRGYAQLLERCPDGDGTLGAIADVAP
jgi:hypothetical protein